MHHFTERRSFDEFVQQTPNKQEKEEYNKENGTNYPLDAVISVPGVELYVKMSPEDKGHFHLTVH